MVAPNHYDEDTLLDLLRNRSRDTDTATLSHVESCETCQEQLESISKSGMTWAEVSELLSPDDVATATEETLFANGILDDQQPRDSSSFNDSFLEPTDHPGSLGRFARYEILEILGRGGMGIVMRGYDTSLNRHSAIKVLAPELASSSAARKRFSREAKSAAAVVHPHVVPIQTVDQHNALPYLVMPVVEGQSVEKRVRDSGPLSVIEAVRIAAQVADGLSAAHEQGLVHRDIKPANILLEDGVERVQITDFGLARAIDDASMTRSGVIAGTPQYMSPEQAHGDTIDHRSDLFSLGSLIYFMLTGHSPFRASTTMGVLNRIGNDEPRPLRAVNADVPQWLEWIANKLLSKSPDNRFASAAEVAALLEDCLAHAQHPSTTPLPEPVAALSSNRSGRPPWLKLVGAAGFAFFFIFAGFLVVLELNKGTLTIKSEADDVPIRIMRGDDVIEILTVNQTPQSVRVSAGNYTVSLEGEFDDLSISNQVVSLKRGGHETVTIARSDKIPNPSHAQPDNATALSAIGDRENDAREEIAQKAFNDLQQKYQAAPHRYLQQRNDEEKAGPESHPVDRTAPNQTWAKAFLEMEKYHRGTHFGLVALGQVLQMFGDLPGQEQHNAKYLGEAVDRLIIHYPEHSGLGTTIDLFDKRPLLSRRDEFLQAVVNRNPDRRWQAAAIIAQVNTLRRNIRAAETRLMNFSPEHEDGRTPEEFDPATPDRLRRLANQKLQYLEKEYGNLSLGWYDTAGVAAKHLSHAINQVVIGGLAPEIAGKSADGNQFRVARHAGNVVAIVFAEKTHSFDDDARDENNDILRALDTLQERYREEGVHVVAFVDDDLWKHAVKTDTDGIACTMVPQKDGSYLPFSWGVDTLPTVFLVDKQRKLHPEIAIPHEQGVGYDMERVIAKIDQLKSVKLPSVSVGNKIQMEFVPESGAIILRGSKEGIEKHKETIRTMMEASAKDR